MTGGSAVNGDASRPRFFSPEPLATGAMLTLGDAVAHHARVLRLDVGATVEVRDGGGRAAGGRLTRLAKRHAVVELGAVTETPPPPPVHLLVPVGDRDRMLWLAEKVVEIGVASWRPVVWRRSRSVGPRGDGTAFRQKVRSRMIAALTQSGGSWLPDVHPDASLATAVAALPAGERLLLHPDGEPLLESHVPGAVALAFGPEGGFAGDELDAVRAAGFRMARLPGHTLRFETAGVVGVALVRAAMERATTGELTRTPEA